MPQQREQHDLFYWENHQRQDADLHNPILNDGDDAAAQAVSVAVMQRLGFSDQQITELMNSKPVMKAFNEDEKRSLELLREFDESEHPRDEDGKWTSGGGGSGSTGSDVANLSDAPLDHGYSKGARLIDGTIHTSNVHDAARALMEDRAVELKQPRQVATLIAYLGRITKHMIASGEKAPRFNLCNVSVPDTNLFCAQSVGIPRIKMPQMDTEQTKAFQHYLEGKGYKVEKTKERSDYLRATQAELDGAKVAKIATEMRNSPKSDRRLVVSRDNYILDGHHHWAAQIGIDAIDNVIGDAQTKVSRVDIGIVELLHEAEAFTGGKGHKKEFDESEHPRDEDGKFTFSGGDSGGGGAEFFSPSVANDLDLPAAISAMSSKQQASLRQASDFIDAKLHLEGKTANAVGAWKDGAENTIADFHSSTKWTDWSRIALAAVMKGHIADQKSVLVFQEEPNRKPRESIALKGAYPHVLGRLNVTVEVNPTGNEIRGMAKEGQVRVLVSGAGDLYAWKARSAIHDQIAGALGLDSTYADIWYMNAGRLVSERYRPLDGSTQDVAQSDTKKAEQEVRDKLISLEGNAVLMSFEAQGSLADIHRNLLSDGLMFHTLIPHAGGATVYAAEVDPTQVKATVDITDKAAARYGSKVTYHYGRGEFIGDFSGSGSDREQRDRARSIYESYIRKSPVHSSEAVWQGVLSRWGKAADQEVLAASYRDFDEAQHPRDEAGRWTDGGGDSSGSPDHGDGTSFKPPAGKTWQGIAQAAVAKWREANPLIAAKTVALVKDIDHVMAEASKYADYRDWYDRHKPLAKELFGANEPYFEKFLAATSINSAGKANVDEALRATIHFINGGTFEKKNYAGVMGTIRTELLKIQHNEPLTGYKVVPFEQVLQGDWDHAPADRHMKELLFAHPTSSGGSRAQGEVTLEICRAISKEMGWKPAELQAVIWCVDKSRQENNLTAIIFDYAQYLKQDEARVRALLATQQTLRSRAMAGFANNSKSYDEDDIEIALQAEADADNRAELLLEYFQAIRDEVGADPTPQQVADALEMVIEQKVLDMAYTAKQRQRINLRAKRTVGLVKRDDAQDKFDFMDQCMSDMMDTSSCDDEGDARDVCQMLWDEQDD